MSGKLPKDTTGSKTPIKLNLIDRKILFELDRNARAPALKIAKNLKISREIVKYRIKNLAQREIIDNFVTIIDPTKYGYQLYKVHLQLSNVEAERERFYQYLKNVENVFWLGFCDGKWDVIITMFARDSLHLYDIMSDFLDKFKDLIVAKAIGNFVHSYFFRKSYLTGQISHKLTLGDTVVHNKLDKIDIKILKVLANNARLPITELSHKINEKPGIIRSKLKQLEQKKIILGYRLDVYLKKLDLETYKAFIYYKHMDQKRRSALFEYISKDPRLSYYLRVLAPWEAEIEFVVKNHREFNEIINDIRKKFSDIIRSYEAVLINEEYFFPGFNS